MTARAAAIATNVSANGSGLVPVAPTPAGSRASCARRGACRGSPAAPRARRPARAEVVEQQFHGAERDLHLLRCELDGSSAACVAPARGSAMTSRASLRIAGSCASSEISNRSELAATGTSAGRGTGGRGRGRALGRSWRVRLPVRAPPGSPLGAISDAGLLLLGRSDRPRPWRASLRGCGAARARAAARDASAEAVNSMPKIAVTTASSGGKLPSETFACVPASAWATSSAMP